MTVIKPIETQYRGYRFRSRLEARWAVFFDALGYPWEYEPEGFTLSGGLSYLPDFRVRYPGRDASEIHFEWFEVKANLLVITEEEWLKMIAFSRDTQQQLTILDGPPAATMYCQVGLICRGTEDVREYEGDGPSWRIPARAELAAYDRPDRYGAALWSTKGRLWWDPASDYFDDHAMSWLGPLVNAINEARTARFLRSTKSVLAPPLSSGL